MVKYDLKRENKKPNIILIIKRVRIWNLLVNLFWHWVDIWCIMLSFCNCIWKIIHCIFLPKNCYLWLLWSILIFLELGWGVCVLWFVPRTVDLSKIQWKFLENCMEQYKDIRFVAFLSRTFDVIDNWHFIGKLVGHFYDNNGNPTEAMEEFENLLKQAKQKQKEDDEDLRRFPPCNSENKVGVSRRLWCSENRSLIVFVYDFD